MSLHNSYHDGFVGSVEICHRKVMVKPSSLSLAPYPQSLAGILLAAREAVMAPIRPELRSANVTEQQWRVLRVLADCKSIDARGIATAALLYPPSVTRILKELAERGLIQRQTDAGDGRRSIIAITAEGRALVNATAAHTLKLLDQYADAFGQARLDALKSEIAAFTAAISPFSSGD